MLLKGWPQPALVGWAAKQTAEYAVQNRKQVWAVAEADEAAAIALLKNARFNTAAMRRGTDIHALIASGGRPTEAEKPYINAYDRWLEEHQVEVIAHEVPIVNETLGYGGTIDLICRFADMTWTIDLKTGSGVYSEHHAQVAAYAKAEYGLPAEITAGGVLLLNEAGPQLHLVDIDAAFEAFQHAAWLSKYCGLIKEPEEESAYV